MTISGVPVRRRLFVGLGLVIIATGMWYYWTRARQQSPETVAEQPEPFVKLASSGQGTDDRVLAERAEFFDPTPLFIPTDRNFGQGPLPARVVRQPGQVFDDIPPNFTFKENTLANYAVGYQTAAESVPEILERGNEVPFAGFGQVDSTRRPVADRAAFIEVKALNTGSLVMSEDLAGATLPHPGFAPVEFLAVVGDAGLVGDPVLTAGSGVEEVDSAIREFLVKTFRLGDRLAPGHYVVSVGP
jgi:hypothetical protein